MNGGCFFNFNFIFFLILYNLISSALVSLAVNERNRSVGEKIKIKIKIGFIKVRLGGGGRERSGNKISEKQAL